MQLRHQFLGFAQEPFAQALLVLDQGGDDRLEFFVIGIIDIDHGGAADDERHAGFVDQDGVHFVDDGEVVAALHLFLGALGHAVVAQIIEAELSVGAVGDVAGVHLAADRRRLVVQDATDRQA